MSHLSWNLTRLLECIVIHVQLVPTHFILSCNIPVVISSTAWNLILFKFGVIIVVYLQTSANVIKIIISYMTDTNESEIKPF